MSRRLFCCLEAEVFSIFRAPRAAFDHEIRPSAHSATFFLQQSSYFKKAASQNLHENKELAEALGRVASKSRPSNANLMNAIVHFPLF